MIGTFAAEIVRSGGGAIAKMAVAAQEERSPNLREHLGPHSMTQWQEDTRIRLLYLAVALEFESPDLFARHLQWQRVAFNVRGVPTDVLTSNLEALAEVLAERLPPEGVAAVQRAIDAGAAALDASATGQQDAASKSTLLDSDEPFRGISERFLDAALNGRRDEACAEIRRAADEGVPIQDLYARVLGPAQQELGRLWHLGRMGVQDEHIASVATATAIAQLHERIARAPRDGRLALGTTVEGDTHDIGLRMACDMLELDGWRTAVLGADTPAEDIIEACTRFQPALLILSATMAIHLPALRNTIAAVRKALGDDCPKILAGGGPFAAPQNAAEVDLAAAVRADAAAGSLAAVAPAAQELAPKPS